MKKHDIIKKNNSETAMGFKFFDKKIKKSCLWCKFGRVSEYDNYIFCLKKGVTGKRDYCRHYKYDIFKRKPEQIGAISDFKEDDFKL